MRSMLAGFAAGVAGLHVLSRLPSMPLLLAMAAAGVILAGRYRGQPVAALFAAALVGFGFAGGHARLALAHRLPEAMEGVTLRVEGRITGLPRQAGYRSVFLFAPDRFPGVSPRSRPRRLRLSWYDPPGGLAPGQRWAFDVRLKRPRGLMNPGAFDYERWLFSRRIDAVGYVRGHAVLRPGENGVDAFRQHLSDRLRGLTGDGDGAALVRALAVADRRGIRPELWSVFNATGTGHLLAISGLHIGLAAGLGAVLSIFLWRRSAALCRLLPPRLAGAAVGLTVAGGYALLAGFGLPTRRAIVMTAVAALALMLRRDWRAVDVFLWAVAAVLAADPLAPLSAGFWLSFWAVAVLLLATSAPGRGRWVGAQLSVSFGLFPLLAFWFAELPWASPLANAVAVPLVSTVVVPLIFAGVGALPFGEGLAQGLLWAAEMLLEGLVSGLSWAAANTGTWSVPALPVWTLVAGGAGLFVLLVPGRWPGRALGISLVMPLVLYRPAPLATGAARVTFADVGQGSAVVVETRRHVLVYDAGPRLGRTDAASAAILPLLRSRGVDSVDRLVISHADSDHAGGAKTLVRSSIPVGDILAGEPLEGVPARPCRRGQSWTWDGVAFRILHPRGGEQGNDASCVLQILAAGGASVLFPGDISKSAERALLRDVGGRLRSALLMVPHHGSASSSSAGFVDAVAPREAVFTVGYRNRYGLPDDGVLARYLLAGTAVREIPDTGALTYVLDERLRLQGQYRQDAARYFHDH